MSVETEMPKAEWRPLHKGTALPDNTSLWNISWEGLQNEWNSPTLTQRIRNMFKLKSTKRIEALEERLKHSISGNTDRIILSEREATARKKLSEYNNDEISKFRKQAGCGVEHETESDICVESKLSVFYGQLDDGYVFSEICTVCKKTLKKFDNKLDADKREVEILQENADKARRAVEATEKAIKEGDSK